MSGRVANLVSWKRDSAGSFRVAVTGVRMPPLNFFVAGAVLLKHPSKSR